MGLISLGTIADADFVIGLSPMSGPSAQVNVDPRIAIALGTGGVYSMTPVSEDEPIFYDIAVSGTRP
jgi:hypothetical protein